MTDADLLAALRDCYSGSQQRNIVELRRVRSAHLVHDVDAPGSGIPGVPTKYVAQVVLESAGSDDDADAQLVAQVSNRLAGLSYVSRAEVSLSPPIFPILNTRFR